MRDLTQQLEASASKMAEYKDHGQITAELMAKVQALTEKVEAGSARETELEKLSKKQGKELKQTEKK